MNKYKWYILIVILLLSLLGAKSKITEKIYIDLHNYSTSAVTEIEKDLKLGDPMDIQPYTSLRGFYWFVYKKDNSLIYLAAMSTAEIDFKQISGVDRTIFYYGGLAKQIIYGKSGKVKKIVKNLSINTDKNNKYYDSLNVFDYSNYITIKKISEKIDLGKVVHINRPALIMPYFLITFKKNDFIITLAATYKSDYVDLTNKELIARMNNFYYLGFFKINKGR